MNLNNLNLFQKLGESIQQIVDTIRQVGTSDKLSELSVLFSVIITLFIMYKGFEVLMGRSQSPIRELTFDIAGKLFAITFALNIGSWLDLSVSAMDGLYDWAGGGTEMYKNLDEMFKNTIHLANMMWEKSSGIKDTFLAVVSMGLCYVAFGVASVPVLAIVVITTFTQTLLVISAPIVFWLLIFKATKNVFTQWTGILLSNTLTILLVGLFLKTFMEQVSSWITYFINSTTGGDEILSTGVFYLVASLMLVIMIICAKFFAEKIANVSFEGAMGEAMSKALSPVGMLGAKVSGFAFGTGSNVLGGAGSLALKGSKVAGKYAAKGAKFGATGGYNFAKKMYERMRNEA